MGACVCVHVCFPSCMSMNPTCAVPKEARRGPWELELSTVVNHNAGVENQTFVLWKSSH